MKEIKFRAWDGQQMQEIFSLELDSCRVSFDGVDYIYSYIMQSTGLLDKNGKEIWSGDIVECYTKNGELVYNGGHEVKLPDFYREIWSLRDDGLPANKGERTVVKIIGNIYENPEFLKK